jgi:hypothetical protein
MENWSKLFGSYTHSDIYSIEQGTDVGEIERLAASHELAFFKVDLSGVDNKVKFLSSISEALEFPSYFGMNWDAFEECLKDLEWYDSDGYVILLQAVEGFIEKAPDDFKTARGIFKSAVEYWKARKKTLFVILLSE